MIPFDRIALAVAQHPLICAASFVGGLAIGFFGMRAIFRRLGLPRW